MKQFKLWVYAAGVRLAGLVTRRHAEAAMFAVDVVVLYKHDSPG